MKYDCTGLDDAQVSTDRRRSRRVGSLAFSARFVGQSTSSFTFLNNLFYAVQVGQRTRLVSGWTMDASSSLRTEYSK
jgi:hypothetical protein